MKSLPFSALLFDLDGTLVNSIPDVIIAWSKWAESKGLDPDYVLPRIHGRPAMESISELLNGASKDEVIAEFKWLEDYEANNTQGTVALEGSVELLKSLNEQGVPWAIVTSGTIPVATARIKAAGLPFPSVLVTPEKLTNGKPHPEPFLTGAKELGVEPSNCICFEDSGAGMLSAKDAGSIVVAVLSHATKEQLSLADHYISAPKDVSVSSSKNEFTLQLTEQ